jgi:hypothetical protein
MLRLFNKCNFFSPCQFLLPIAQLLQGWIKVARKHLKIFQNVYSQSEMSHQ